MSDRNRGKRAETLTLTAFCAVALIGTMILLYTLGTLNGRESERREQTPASYSQSAKADAERACVGLDRAALFECVYERVEASQEQARGEQDLSAQQRSATSALASAVIALLTLGVTIIGVWFIKRTLDATLEAVEDTGEATEEMRIANQIAKESAQRQARAYLFVKSARIEMGFFEDDAPYAILEIDNAGQTPGVIEEISTNVIWFCRPEPAQLIDKEERIEVSVHPATPKNLPFPLDDIDGALKKTGWFMIMGRVDYVDVFGGRQVEPFAFGSHSFQRKQFKGQRFPIHLAMMPLSAIGVYMKDVEQAHKARTINDDTRHHQGD